MRQRTGHHAARRQAAKTEPSPLTALRELLAAAFAADVAAVTPMVCDVLRDEISVTAAVHRRDVLRRALVLLARNTEALGEAAGRLFRERFDLHLSACELPPGVSPELSRALVQCSERLQEQAAVEVEALGTRLADLLGHDAVDAHANPIVPAVFARTVLEALATLGLDDEGHLAAFRAFGPALLHITPDLYSQANLLLFERGAAPAKDDRAAVLERLLAGRMRR